ncbi:hypothetical protein BH11ARM2_BH11ARM2_12190 [soil metagenome]
MPRQTDRSNGPKGGAVLFTALFAALGVGAMATYMARTPASRTIPTEMRREEPTHKATATERETSVPKPVAKGGVRLPVLKDEVVSLSDTLTPTSTPIKEVTQAALKVAGMDGIELMGATLKDGTVTLDFNQALSNGVGSMQEGRFIDSLTLGLRQIPAAQRFRLFAEGKPIETLGHIQFGESVSLKQGEEPQP